MPYVQNPDTGMSYWVDDAAAPAAPAAPAGTTAPIGQTRHSGPGAGVPVDPQKQANDALRARLDPSHPDYVGPGYSAFTDETGALVLRLTDPLANEQWKTQQAMVQSAEPTLDYLEAAVAEPPAAPSVQQRLTTAQTQGVGAGGFQAPIASRAPRPLASSLPTPAANLFPLLPAPGTPGGATPEEMGPAEVDRARIDALLGNVSRATSGLLGLATLEDQYSAAQAQLAQGLDQSQRQALALARSGNRRDAAAMQARALQTGAELAAQATQSSALLRAQEEDAQQRLKLDAFKAAGDLGLNASALEVDVNNLNMQAATSYLNQLFETNRLGLQLDEAKAQRVTNFIRDMALIAKDYYALDMAERQAIRDDLTRRYGIDEQTRVALAQIEAGENFDWNALAVGIVSGAGSGATAAIAKSDRRAKRDIDDHAEEELAELLESIGTKTYRYKRPEKDGKGRFAGPMYQDLEKTEIGRSMLAPQKNGDKMVDGARAGLAALAGLAMVYEKLKALEAAL